MSNHKPEKLRDFAFIFKLGNHKHVLIYPDVRKQDLKTMVKSTSKAITEDEQLSQMSTIDTYSLISLIYDRLELAQKL